MKKITLKAVKEKLAEKKSLETFLRKKRVYTKYVRYAYNDALAYETLKHVTNIYCAFAWSNTEEGRNFWSRIDNKYSEHVHNAFINEQF